MAGIDRRTFLAGIGAATALGPQTRASSRPARVFSGDEHRGRCVLASANGRPAVRRAMELIAAGRDPVDAVVEGVRIVEDDPDDTSVGFGGLPNEDGVVQLDASVMHGPTHKAGAVAAIEGIRNPAAVALQVLKRTDHVLLVGEGAKRFALAQGFVEENLLTDRARRAWLRWKASLSDRDDWLDDEQSDIPPQEDVPGAMAAPHERTWGTINCSAVDDAGDLASCTTTSGLSYKIPGRVGDSPIVGAGMYVDNEVGAAGATGRGEAVIQSCGAYTIVREMEAGRSPTEACLAALERIASRTRQRRLLDDRGRPNFQVVMYAVRKDGAYGGASMLPGRSFAVHDGEHVRLAECAALFE